MMDASEIEENMFVAADAKLHGEICRKLSVHVCKILEIFPVLEAARPRSKSGIQSLCSLHVALDRAKNLLRHCSTCSKLYLAITGDSILLKFEKMKGSLQESLTRVEDIVPQAVGCQVMNIVGELGGTTFTLDESEKRAGDELIQLLQTEKKFDGNSNDTEELETFHQAALQLGITSSRAALTERRALKKIIERARAEEDKRKESIVAYLLHLMRKYSKLFRSEVSDDTDSQGSAPCSPTVQGVSQDSDGHGGIHAFDRQLSKLCSFNFKPTGMGPGSMPLPPEEFRCPISLQLMYDPVIISSGQTYERVCIEKWFSDGHVTCPKTKQHLSHLSLTPNYCVKGLIASWCEHNGFPVPSGPPDSLDLNYWRLVLSEHVAADPRSVASIDSCKTRSFKATPFKQNNEREDNAAMEEPKGNYAGNLAYSNFSQEDGIDEYVRYENLLACLYNGKTVRERQHAVEQIRFLLKDDEEARVYMGANGFTEGLVQFLRSAVEEEDEDAQAVGAMALFNLAVNNNRNKGLMLSTGVIPLLEEMISNSIYESATALYLNLSCLDDAKSAIGASRVVPFLVQILKNDDNKAQCRADALHTLFNLSTDQPNISNLLSAGIVEGLHSLITGCTIPDEAAWAEKAVAIFINLALNNSGKKTIVATPGLVGAIASLLDTAERSGQEKVVCCLLLLCDGDQVCCDMVLQEGVVPVLVAVSVNGTARGKEKAQKLLMMFREQREREPSSPKSCQQQPSDDSDGASLVTTEANKTLVKTVSRRRVGRLWKNKHFSLYQC